MDDLVEDEEFLSLLDAAEANAMKRRKLNGSEAYSSQGSNYSSRGSNDNMNRDGPNEGRYTAALRGSNSQVWQASVMNTNTNKKPAEYSSHGGGGGDVCYKCQQPGHWAKDCVSAPARQPNRVDDSGPPVPEKECQCGRGLCIVLTANTEKNRGRKFYRCPLRDDGGRCGFFEWCDAAQGFSGGYGVKAPAFNDDFSKASKPSAPELFMECECGAGPCSVLTARTEKNMGRQFFKCPIKQGEGACSFFKWCDEVNLTSDSSPFSTRGFPSRNDSTSGNSGRTGPSPCYKCGITGHWAKDCPRPSSAISAASGIGHGENSTTYNTCFKCGQTGHWAKDCHSQAPNSPYAGRNFSDSSYKRGGTGYQASPTYRSK